MGDVTSRLVFGPSQGVVRACLLPVFVHPLAALRFAQYGMDSAMGGAYTCMCQCVGECPKRRGSHSERVAIQE